MTLGKLLPALALLLLAPRCHAAETSPADFSNGFKQLSALGLPQLPAGTKWSVLPESLTSGSLSDSALVKDLKGNGWLLPPPDSGKQQVLPMCEVSLTEIDSEEASKTDSPGLLGRMFGGGKKQPSAKSADLAKDIETLCNALEKLAPQLFAEDNYRAKQEEAHFGRFLILAAQIDQSGQPKLANDLATALFLAAPDREPVIDSAINQLATQQLEAATNAFFQSKDWKAYHRATAALIAKFPRGWNNLSAAALLLDPLSKRAAGTPPPAPALAGIQLDPAAVSSVQWMTDEKPTTKTAKQLPPEIEQQLASLPARYRAEYLKQMSLEDDNSIGQTENWLLKKPEDLKENPGISLPTLQLGIAALPVLAALATDSYLTLHPNPESNGYSDDFSSSDDTPVERALQFYASMNRPATRGDLAIHLLKTTLPDPETELYSADPQTVSDLALDFWKSHQHATRDQLALTFLKQGSQEQQAEAAQLLTASSDPANHRALETHILEDGSPVRHITTVQTYVKTRKSAAKPFLTLYIKALRDEVGDGDLKDINDLPWEIRELGKIEPLIKQLESQASGTSPQARAREIATEDPKTARAAIPVFIESLSDLTPRKRLLALLAGAVAADDPEVRTLFIQSMGNYEQEAEVTQAPRVMPAKESKAWKTLLADTRPTPQTISRGISSIGKTVGEMAAIALENNEDPSAFGNFNDTHIITGKSFAEIAIPRATARLASEPIPPLPDASKVSRERLKEIVATAATKPPLEIHPYLKTLSDDERAAWLKWYEEPGDIVIPENIRKLSKIITTRWADHWSFKDTPTVVDLGIGFEVSKTSIETLVQKLSNDAANNSRCFITIYNADFPPGLKILTTKIEPSNTDEGTPIPFNSLSILPPASTTLNQVFNASLDEFQSPDLAPNSQGIIHIMMSGRRGRSSPSVWQIIDGKPVLKTTATTQKDTLAVLEQETSHDDSFSLTLQILSRADAEALKDSE